MRQIKLLFDLNVDIRLSKEQCKIVMNHISELEDLASMIIDAEPADTKALYFMYKVWLRKAKALKHQQPTEE